MWSVRNSYVKVVLVVIIIIVVVVIIIIVVVIITSLGVRLHCSTGTFSHTVSFTVLSKQQGGGEGCFGSGCFLVRVVKIQDSGLVWFGVCGTCRDQRRAEHMCRLGRRGPQAFNKKILD